MNQSYPGRAKYQSNVAEPTGELLVAVQCLVGARTSEDAALVDTASRWCVLPPSVALALGYTLDAEGDTHLHTRFGLLSGELIRLPVVFAADEGEPAEVEATWFLSADRPGPMAGTRLILHAEDPSPPAHLPPCAILQAEVTRMGDSVSSQPTPETAADQEAAMEGYLAEIRRLIAQMQNDRGEIERLKAETLALKAENQRLKAETRASLARLGADV